MSSSSKTTWCSDITNERVNRSLILNCKSSVSSCFEITRVVRTMYHESMLLSLVDHLDETTALIPLD